MAQARAIQVVCQCKLAGFSLTTSHANKIGGAFTNDLFRVEDSSSGSAVIVRFFGHGTDQFFDREEEHELFCSVAEVGMGPHMLGSGEGWRIEQYLPLHPSKNQEFWEPNFQNGVLETLAAFHGKMEKSPLRNASASCTESRRLSDIQKWMKVADEAHQKRSLHQDWDSMKEHALAAISPMQKAQHVICHGDVNVGNTLRAADFQTPVSFIDVEYAGPDPPAFDIANWWTEMAADYDVVTECGFNVECPEKLPSEDSRRRIIGHYVKCATEYGLAWLDGKENQLHDDAWQLVAAAHAYWGIWGMLQHALRRDSPAVHADPMDYLKYGETRMRMAREHMELNGVPQIRLEKIGHLPSPNTGGTDQEN